MKKLILLLMFACFVPALNLLLYEKQNDRMTIYFELSLLDKVNLARMYDSDYSLKKWYVEQVESKKYVPTLGE